MFWKFAYPSLAFTLLLKVNLITNTQIPSSKVIFENVLKIRVDYLVGPFFFVRIFTHFRNIMGYRIEVGGGFSEFCECSQNSRNRLPYTAPLFS